MKIGLITYHSAYNFGSMLQAYATQEAIKKAGCEVVVLNYRMPSQKTFYKEYRTEYGKLNFVQDILQFPMHRAKIERKNNFEKFLKEYFNLGVEFNEPDEMQRACKGLDAIVSGSDQIWNAKSCEFVNCDIRYMSPYLLDGFAGKKISYASSIGHMEDEELERIIPYIESFDHLSAREETTQKRISKYINKSIDTVLDPTFLLDKVEWINNFGLKRKDERPYILFYSLKRFNGNKVLKEVIEFARERHLIVKYVMPFSYYFTLDKDVLNCESFGPIDFLQAIYDSRMVITDSYHGTILSLNLNKNVYSLCGKAGAEFRKTEIMERLGIGDRIVGCIDDIAKNENEICFGCVNEKISVERMRSFDYLIKSLNS